MDALMLTQVVWKEMGETVPSLITCRWCSWRRHWRSSAELQMMTWNKRSLIRVKRRSIYKSLLVIIVAYLTSVETKEGKMFT